VARPGSRPRVADATSADGFTHRQRTLLSVCDELLATRALSDSTWSAVQATLSKRESIELCVLIGNYQGLASAIGGLGIQIETDRRSSDGQRPADRA
jgi:hypothetical protein